MNADEAEEISRKFQECYKAMDANKSKFFQSKQFKRGTATISFFKTAEVVLGIAVVLILLPVTAMGLIGLFGFLLV